MSGLCPVPQKLRHSHTDRHLVSTRERVEFRFANLTKLGGGGQAQTELLSFKLEESTDAWIKMHEVWPHL
eukprot:5468927-Amphidinium_carterae.1